MLKQDSIFKKYQFVKPVKCGCHLKADWCIPGKIAGPNMDIWFTTTQLTTHCVTFV
jgi:hypothetical protein